MKNKKLLNFVVTGMLIAVEIIMAFTPFGYFKYGLLSITFMTVPIIIGSITTGVYAGTILGLVFGITSFIQCFGTDMFGTTLFSINPLFTAILCLLPRTLMGLCCALIFKFLKNKKIGEYLKFGITAFSAPFLNTIFFVPALILFFWNSDYIQELAAGANVFAFIIALVGINGIVEWIVCTLLGTAISIPLSKAVKINN